MRGRPGLRRYRFLKCDQHTDRAHLPRPVETPSSHILIEAFVARSHSRETYLEVRGSRESRYGEVLPIQIGRYDGGAMTWPAVQRVFNRAYPGHWAFQVHPPASCLVDEVNAYHLWVLPHGVAPEFRIDDPGRTE